MELVDNSGLELVSSSAGPSGTANGTKISGASATGITDLGSYTFKVPTVTSDTTYKIKEVQITTHQTIQQVQIIIVQQSHQKQD